MVKKNGKEKKKKAPNTAEKADKSNDCNLTDLVTNLVINDENWRCIVTMLVETTEAQKNYETILEKAFENGYRKSVRLINRKKMLSTVHATSKPEPSYTAEATPSLQHLRECARTTLTSSSTFNPVTTLATAELIKWMIYEARLESLARSAAEVEVANQPDREFQAMQQQETARGPLKKGETTKRPESARRTTSRLRRRGEEWRDEVCVDDAPTNGPSLYILLTGFHEPGLPSELIKLGVPLNCIFRLENLRTEEDEKVWVKEELTSGFEVAGGSLSTISKFNMQDEFWNSLNDDTFKEVAVRPFCPPWHDDSDLNDIYNSMSYAMYDVNDLLLSHADYLASMRIINVYEPRPESQSTDVYEQLLGGVPEECVRVPLVLEAMLRQVEEYLKDEPLSSPRDTDVSASSTNISATSAAFVRLSEKLRLLNLKYELDVSTHPTSSTWRYGCPAISPPAVVELILHGDMEKLNACRAGMEEDKRMLPSADVEANWVAGLWKEGDEEENANCKKHVPGVLECCAKEGIDRTLANHLLNLLAFRKMLEESNNTLDDSLKTTSLLKPEQRNYEPSSTPAASYPEKINRKELESYWPQEIRRNTSKDINLSENNCEARSVPRIVHSVENRVREMDKVCSIQQRNIIFDESREPELGGRGEPYFKENENSTASLNANPKQMRITELVGEGREEDGRNCGTVAISDTTSCPCLQHSTTSAPQPYRVKSLTTSRFSTLPSRISFHPRSISDDTQQRKRRCLQDFERCEDLFGLIDARESCGLASTTRTTALEEFEDAEVLGADAFRQIVRHWLGMDGWTCEKRRFVTTDSILLLFRDELAKTGTLVEHRFTFAPRTALCLRDFTEYIVDEEHEWLEQRRKLREDTEGAKNRRWNEDGPIFRDEDFVLPGSLKACELQLQREEKERLRLEELERMEEEKRKLEEGEKEKGKSKKKGKEKDKGDQENAKPSKKPNKKPSQKPTTPPPPEVPPEPIETQSPRFFDFIGYDLGEHRVQVTNLAREFSSRDGTRVHIGRATGDKKHCTSVRIEVENDDDNDNVEGCTLWYHEEEGKEGGVFHLTMDNGVIVAFERIRGCELVPRMLPFEIQMSWPSGLIIRPSSQADWPFYILQYYMDDDEGPEKYRKYMNNGDVVKFFKDGRVVVLRACGRVITLVNFEGGDGDSEMSCESDGCEMGEDDEEMLAESLDVMRELGCPETNRSTGLRYVVLEPDGQQYEVRGRRGAVRELDRLRASLAEEYAPEEKFLRRADGTDALFTNDGELIVSFPDGTRILSNPYTESTPATCDWSPDELDRYFPNGLPPDDGFVSILPRGRAEHARYATVVHEIDDSMRVTMGQVCVRLEPRGYGSIEIGNRICVELTDDTVIFTRRACPHCPHFTSRATFHLLTPPYPLEPLLTFDDIANHLTICHDGSVWRKSRGCPSTCTCAHDDINKKPRFRLFTTNRDGTAHEYHHRSELENTLDAMGEEDEASLVRDEIEGRCGMEWRIGLRPIPRVIGTSRKWRMDYEIREAKPTRRRDVDDDEVDEPLLTVATAGDVKKIFLMARVFEGIGRHGKNALAVVQEALVKYWREIATGIRSTEDDESVKCECLDETTERMHDVALGHVRTVAPEIYEAGRQHLRRIKVQRDEARVRRMIDRAYSRPRDYKCPR